MNAHCSNSNQRPSLSCGIIWSRLGPYHASRLKAAREHGEVGCVEIYAHDSGRPWKLIPSEGATRRTTLFESVPSGGPTTPEMVARLEAALEALAPDVVIVPSWGEKYALAALRWCLRTRTVPVVMTESTQFDRKRVWWREGTKRLLVRRFSAGIVASSRASRYLQGLGLPASRIRTKLNVVDNHHFATGADEARRNAAEHQHRLGLPKRFFLSVCRFVKEKNLPGLLSAYRLYRDRVGSRTWPLVLVGDGPDRSIIDDVIRRNSLDTLVLFPGFKQYEEIPAYYGLASVFLLPSLSETWGYVVNEAEACGLPVLVSNQCGCCEDLVQEGVNGWTFHPKDYTRLAQLMTDATLGSHDLTAMGEASRRLIDGYSLDAFAENLWQTVQCAQQERMPPFTPFDRCLFWTLIHARR